MFPIHYWMKNNGVAMPNVNQEYTCTNRFAAFVGLDWGIYDLLFLMKMLV